MRIQPYTMLGNKTNPQHEAIERFRLALLDLRDFGRVRALPKATHGILQEFPEAHGIAKELIDYCYQRNGDILVYDNARFERVCKPTRVINPKTGEVFKFDLNTFFTSLVKSAKTIFKKSV